MAIRPLLFMPFAALLLCAPAATLAAGPCKPLPAPRAGPLPFPSGELLTFDIDVNGVRAATMTYETLPRLGTGEKASIPIRVKTQSNTLFKKVRDVKADIKSTLRGSDLRPATLTETITEDSKTRKVTVTFPKAGGSAVQYKWSQGDKQDSSTLTAKSDALDYAGAMAFFRAMPMKVGDTYCFEVYSGRRLWRIEGSVAGREKIDSPVGVFQAFHLSATAERLGGGKPMKRDVHLWITDDDKRLPLAAVGTIDLGAVRATLSKVARPDMKAEAPKQGSMDW